MMDLGNMAGTSFMADSEGNSFLITKNTYLRALNRQRGG